MTEFDDYCNSLFEEAKYYLERAKTTISNPDLQQAMLHSSLLLGMSALEAYINAIAEELCSNEGFNLNDFEKALLLERKLSIDHGIVRMEKGLQMSRLIDRIEFIYCKYSHRKIDNNAKWVIGIKETIQIRNDLVHPKIALSLTYEKTNRALEAILDTLNELYLAVYKRRIPIYNYGLQSITLS